MLRLVIALAALVLISPLAAAAPEESDTLGACRRSENETIVCDNGKRILRVIRDSISPRETYAVAWGMVDDRDLRNLKPEQPSAEAPNARTVNCTLCGDVLNFLVRLSDGKVLKRLDGKHFGDEPRYNHYVHKMSWSPDEHYFVQITDWKFGSTTAAAYAIGANDRVSAPLRLVPPARRAAARALKRGQDKDYVLEKTAFIEAVSLDDDGTLKLTAAMAAPKDDGFSFDMTMRLKPNGYSLGGDITFAEQRKD